MEITQRKLAEAALRQSEEDLRQAQKMEAVGRLAGGIAHDFNNLLTGIMGYTELALLKLQQDQTNPQLENYVQEIKNGCERSATLISQLLAVSRKQLLQPKIINLNEVISGIQNLLQAVIGENIKFNTYLDPALHSVEIDPGQLDQVIMNLTINARDAMPQGGELNIETHNVTLNQAEIEALHLDAPPGDYVMLAVSDTGSGFDAETKQHIFEPFYTTKPVGKGTGLGLSTVYGIIRQSKGHLWVTSQVGAGTTFRVYLPACHSNGTPDAANIARPGEGSTGNRETVLLVEDEAMVRAVTRELLEMNGFETIEAANGLSAIKALSENPRAIRLIITDVRMPDMSGLELVDKLKQIYPGLKVLFISGYADVEIAAFGSEVEFLQKPYNMQQLIGKIKALLAGPIG